MTRKFLFFLLLFVWGGFSPAPAQDAEKKKPEYGWKNVLVGNLNFTQTQLNNWSQGGEDNWVWQLDINGKFVNDQPGYNWANSGRISYGRSKIGDAESQKSADEIRMESVYTHKLGVYVNPYVAVSGQTQFTKGYRINKDTGERTVVSKFLNPGYFTESVGVGYQPIEEFKTRLGLAFKQTVSTDEGEIITTAGGEVLQFARRFSDDPDTPDKIEKVRSEVGIESVSDYDRKLAENIQYVFKLELFSNFKSLDAVDVRWDNLVSAKVSKYITVSFNFQLFYDQDISPQRQIKQVLAAGLSYSFL